MYLHNGSHMLEYVSWLETYQTSNGSCCGSYSRTRNKTTRSSRWDRIMNADDEIDMEVNETYVPCC